MAAPLRDYVVHAASPTRKQTIPDRRDFGRTPPLKGARFCPVTVTSSPSVTTSSLFLFLNCAKLFHLCFSHIPLAQIRLRIPLVLHTSRFIYLSLTQKTPTAPNWTAVALSTVTEGREPEGNALDSPFAQLQAQTAPTARRPDDMDDANLARALTTALKSEQMEVLLRRLLRQSQPMTPQQRSQPLHPQLIYFHTPPCGHHSTSDPLPSHRPHPL